MAEAARRSIVVGTAGHIDHGKTSLVKALTGINTDRLQEEQRRGITIELGFAPLDIGDVHVGFVDVPGHEKFVRNMLAGAGGIDAMLLVVAGDESVMPQTREHVEICRLLGIEQALVAVTKADLVDAETLDLVALETAELLEQNGWHDVPVIPVSAVTGAGLEELKSALAAVADRAVVRNERALPRLPIDRVFTIRGFGTVVTGTLVSGVFTVGDAVEILPSGQRSTIKGLQVHGAAVKSATAGHRVAVNIANVPTEAIERGDFLTLAGQMTPTKMFDLHCRMLPDAPCDLEQNQRVRFHIGAAELIGRVAVVGEAAIPRGGEGFVRIRLEQPTAALAGDRFVIRRYSPMITIGGGSVLDPLPRAGKEDRSLHFNRLTSLAAADTKGRVGLFVRDARSVVGVAHLAARFGLLRPEAEEVLRSLVADGEAATIVESPLQICALGYFDEIKATILQALERVHAANPLAGGIATETLRKNVPRGTGDQLFRAAIETLQRAGAVRVEGAIIAAANHSVDLDAGQQEAIGTLERLFREAGTAPPAPAEAIKSLARSDARALFDLLLARGALVRIAQDFFCHRAVFDDLLKNIRDRAGDGTFSVPEFKEWFGISRKYAIPLLEYLDAQAITYREGDARRLVRR